MIVIDRSKQILASKRLSKIRVQMSYGPLRFYTLWCRTAYNESETWTRKLHRHTFFELHFCMSGQCRYLSDGNPVTLCADMLMLLPPKKQHQILEPSPDFSELVMGFTLEADSSDTEAAAVLKSLHSANCQKTYPAVPSMHSYVQQILEIALVQPPFGGRSINALVYLLLLDVAKQVLPHSAALVESRHDLKQDPRVDGILKFLRDNLQNPITASDISKHFNMSLKQLNRIVKSSTSLTLTQLIEQQKTAVIKHLLEYTDLSLFEISQKTGYSNEYNMNRFFKRTEGLPPGKYRSSLKK